jgi:hypothetical protein
MLVRLVLGVDYLVKLWIHKVLGHYHQRMKALIWTILMVYDK